MHFFRTCSKVLEIPNKTFSIHLWGFKHGTNIAEQSLEGKENLLPTALHSLDKFSWSHHGILGQCRNEEQESRVASQGDQIHVVAGARLGPVGSPCLTSPVQINFYK